VSLKTVQAWEAGTNKPTGTALRLFQILDQDSNALKKYILVEA
jgi:DNA-binding transcriptional regulator YiaG